MFYKMFKLMLMATVICVPPVLEHAVLYTRTVTNQYCLDYINEGNTSYSLSIPISQTLSNSCTMMLRFCLAVNVITARYNFQRRVTAWVGKQQKRLTSVLRWNWKEVFGEKMNRWL